MYELGYIGAEERLEITMAQPKKSFVTLAEDLKKIRKRPLTQAEIDKANRVFEKMERGKKAPTPGSDEAPKRKIARPREADI